MEANTKNDDGSVCTDKNACQTNLYSNKDDHTCITFTDCTTTAENQDRMFINFNKQTCVKESFCKGVSTGDNQYVNYEGSTCLDSGQCYAIN